MTRLHPTCDRHTNLQMVPCWVQRAKAVADAHVCPVPGCGRYHVVDVYLEATEVELVLGPQTASPPKSMSKKSGSIKAGPDKPMNRHTAARAAILKAIEQKSRP
jgi:hypothetical protein